MSTGFSDAIFTMRTRSRAVTMTWRAGSCALTPTRRRSVSGIAATIATVRISAAISNGSRNWLNSALASHAVFDMPAAAAGSAGAGICIERMPISVSISTSMTTATMSPIGIARTNPSRSGTRSMSSIITTKRNSTMTAPT